MGHNLWYWLCPSFDDYDRAPFFFGFIFESVGPLLGSTIDSVHPAHLPGAAIPLIAFMVNFEVSPIFEFGCAMAVLTIVAAVTITAFGFFLKVNNLKQYERA